MTRIALVTVLFVLTTTARAQNFDPALSTVTGPPSNVTVVISPFAQGDSFAARGATITVTVLDWGGVPIAGLPRQDIWLDDPGDGALNMCLGSSFADAATDANGVTTFSGRLGGGGASETVAIYVAGLPILGPPVMVSIISPDYDGNQRVDIVDVGTFAQDFASGTNPARSDFTNDGVLDIADLGRFAIHVGEECRP